MDFFIKAALFIIAIIVLYFLLEALYVKNRYNARIRRHKKEAEKYIEKKKIEYEDRIKREEILREKKSSQILPRFMNSQCVRDCAERIKQTITQTPYDWSVRVTSYGLEGSSYIRFYDLGYENLADGYEIVAFAKALAFHLGTGFEYFYYIPTDYEYDCEKCLIRYKSKPLKSI